jgi:hypothetical protein
LEQTVQLDHHSACELTLRFVTRKSKRSAGGRKFDPYRFLNTTQVFILMTEEIMKKAMVLKLKTGSVSIQLFKLWHSPPLRSLSN